mmetsp:Transcript_27161/g.58493  ORF Transcript_27161/g.58493 Transcript_27161/m.58493 type:complete len:227 (-) Transcript_27161:8-688(-)
MQVPRGPVCCTSSWIEARIFCRSVSPPEGPAKPAFFSKPVLRRRPNRMPLPTTAPSANLASSSGSFLGRTTASCSSCLAIISLTSLLWGSSPALPLDSAWLMSSASRVSSGIASSSSSSSTCPSMIMPSVFFAGAVSLDCSSFAPSFTLGGLLRAVVGRVERLSPSSPSSCRLSLSSAAVVGSRCCTCSRMSGDVIGGAFCCFGAARSSTPLSSSAGLDAGAAPPR